MQRNKTFLKLGVFVSLLLFSFSCSSEQRTTVLKLGHGLDPSHSVHKAMEFMAQQVGERSEGRTRIDIYPSEQLGSERECLELLQIGSLDMTKVSCSVLEGFVPAMSVLSLPYIFRDEEHRFQVLEGEVGKSLLLEGEEFWLRGLCYFDAGTRSFYSKNKPILNPKDLEGLKIRTQESPTSIKMVQAMGGSATPIAWGELYSALQQGVVDGAENNPPSFYLSRHYEVCKFYALDEHTGVPDVLLISTKSWRDLTKEARQILQEAVEECAQLQKTLWKDATRLALEEVRKAGVEIHYPNKAEFVQKVQLMYDDFKSLPEIDTIIQKIKNVK
ncbi:TRAP transporter substrate-binding protein [Acidobacteriota bacterium]